MTLPQQIENQQIEMNKKEISLQMELLQKKILSNTEKLSLLGQNDDLRRFCRSWISNNISTSDYDLILDDISDFIGSSENFPFLTSDTILELGLDIIEEMVPSAHDFTNDKLTRVLTFINNQTSNQQFINNNTNSIPFAEEYDPFYQIKSFYPNKLQYTSTITQWTNFTSSNQIILDKNQHSIPVTVHSQIIQADNGSFIGLIYSIISATPLLDIVSDIEDPEFPTVLLDRYGTILYHSNESLRFTKVKGYYSTLLNDESGLIETTVHPVGFQGEITIFRQVIIDIDQAQALLLVKTLPRGIILQFCYSAVIQSALIVIICVILATTLATIATQTITGRLKNLTEAIEQVSKGNFEFKVDINGSDDLATLARSFNRMARSVKYLMKEKEAIEIELIDDD